MKLGDDFASDDEEVETKEEEIMDESEEEQEEDSTGASTGEDENEESKEDEEDEKDEEDDDDKKKRELQGLETAEKEIDDNLSDLDININKARERIVAKRQSRRDKRQIIQEVDKKIPDKETDNLEDIDTDAVATIERVIKAKGYVKQQDVEQKEIQTAHKTAQDDFYAKHPEYDTKNDKDDFLYKALCAELNDFASPTDSKKIPVLFEKAHMAVKLAHPEFFKEAKVKKIVEKAERIKKAGTGGGGSNSGASSEEESETLSDRKKQILFNCGWSEEDINEL